MSPDRVSNPGPLTYEAGALPIALRGPAPCGQDHHSSLGFVLKSGNQIHLAAYGWLVQCSNTVK